MPDAWQIIGWALIALVLIICGIFAFNFFRYWLKQELADWKRKRAHAGKVRCEDRKEHCTNVATRVTPHGYFCEEHQAQNSKKLGMFATVGWSHMLEHHMKGRR